MKNELTPQILACYCGSDAKFYGSSDYWFIYSVGASGAVVLKNGLHTEVVHEDNLSLNYDLMLRSLDSLTEAEARELYAGNNDETLSDLHKWITKRKPNEISFTPTAWLYLLSLGIDLFDLIPQNLAKSIK